MEPMLIIVMDKFKLKFVFYDTPLTAAVKSNNEELIQVVLNGNPNVNIEDKDGKDPLYLAIENGNNELFNKLIEMPEIDLAKVYTQTGQTVLHVSCQCCNYEIVESILNNELTLIQPDLPDNNGNTPLHLAAAFRPTAIDDEEYQKIKQDQFNIIRELISLGCDPSQSNKIGKCPFTLAMDDETREVMGTAISEAGYQEARQQRIEYWKKYKQELATTRYEKKKEDQKAQQTTMKKNKTQRNVKLETMTLKGGTLRDTNARLSSTAKTQQLSMTEVRPWGGSKETDLYRRQIRLKLRKMNNELHETLQKMLDQAHELENKVFGEKDANEEENQNEIENMNEEENQNEIQNANEEENQNEIENVNEEENQNENANQNEIQNVNEEENQNETENAAPEEEMQNEAHDE